jgi:ABC-type uncharacterized transport system substrate-binding protein
MAAVKSPRVVGEKLGVRCAGKTSGAKLMRIKIPSWLLTAILLATVSSVAAQQPKKVPRIGYLSSLSPSSESSVREVKEDLPAAARALGLTVQPSELRDADSVARVFAAMVKQHPDGLYLATGALMRDNAKRIADFALKNRLPAVYPYSETVDAGGLMSYSADPGNG